MIDLVIINEHNQAIEHRCIKSIQPHGRAVKLTPDLPVGDLIYILPEWPPIGDPEFAEKLRAWHAAHNKDDAGPVSD